MINFTTTIRRLATVSTVMVCMLMISTEAMARMGKSIFNGAPTEDQCRLCHGDNENQPHPVLQTVNADRHHALVGKPIDGLYYGWHETVAPGDTSEGEYHCLTCHLTEYSDETGEMAVILVNDCLQCHPAWSVTGMPMRGSNVHHATESFQRRQCRNCHGFLSGSSQGGSMSSRGGRGGRGGMGGRGGRGGMGGRW